MDFTELINSSLDFVLSLMPIFIPVVLAYALFNIWLQFARSRFLAGQEYTLIRIIPPKEITKTPAAMELFITSLHQTGGEANAYDVYWKGKSRAWFSLEIVSNAGEVSFYIWTRKSLKKFIENQIYAQYPGIEVIETEDYVDKVDYFSGNYNMFGMEYKLSEPDPVPIKTYVDYGLHMSNTDEEEKIDPITPTLELLGSLGSGEHAWIQFIVKAHKKEDKKPGTWFGKTDNWVDEARKMIIDIKKESVYKDPDDPEGRPIPLQTKVQEEKINAIERSVTKLGFDVGIRSVYIAEKDAFNGINIPGLIGTFKQYGSTNLNGFKLGFTTSYNFWWQDPLKTRIKNVKEQFYNDYRNRVYFDTIIDLKQRKKMVLNTEELATLFHFPGGVASTPTLSRVQSRKGEAPTNLPM
jgi:hypothetical protein